MTDCEVGSAVCNSNALPAPRSTAPKSQALKQSAKPARINLDFGWEITAKTPENIAANIT
jgi:hypothetical protein